MAKKTYSDVIQQIEKLKAEAEALKREEVDGVVARIREAVQVYGLTAEDIFGRSAGRAAVKLGRMGGHKRGSVPGTQYADGHGNTWGGRGPRPHWLREALGNGASLESFLVRAAISDGSAEVGPAGSQRGAAKAGRAGGKAARKGGSRKRTVKAMRAASTQYADDKGNSWAGRGPRPKWLREALESGATLESFAVPSASAA
jgi:DNA-binding protein H-NS